MSPDALSVAELNSRLESAAETGPLPRAGSTLQSLSWLEQTG